MLTFIQDFQINTKATCDPLSALQGRKLRQVFLDCEDRQFVHQQILSSFSR